MKTLRQWYLENRRDLPWRQTRDPYPIWLSEIILQQTRVNQGLPYYHRFLEAFPEISDLALAPPDKVMRIWQGLGYYSRARNLQAAAQQVLIEHQGKFPVDYPSIRALKGVGDYTAAAIASFSFGLPHAVVDGNVYRFLSRLTGNSTPIDTTDGKKEFSALAEELLDRNDPGVHNQAMMELGATVCLPANPRCNDCPFMAACAAFLDEGIDELPVKSKKQKVTERYFHYFIFEEKGHTWIRSRTGKDIWRGLYEFPLVETGKNQDDLVPFLSTLNGAIRASRRVRHLLSHQTIHAVFYRVVTGQKPLKKFGALQKVAFEDLENFAFPQLLVNYLKSERF